MVLSANLLRVGRMKTLWSLFYALRFGNRNLGEAQLQHECTLLAVGIAFYSLYATTPIWRKARHWLMLEAPFFVRAEAYACAIALCWVFLGSEPKPFIYFQF
jgi:hypothetical protein